MGDRVLGNCFDDGPTQLLGLFCWASSSAKMNLGWQEDFYGVIETFHSVIAKQFAMTERF